MEYATTYLHADIETDLIASFKHVSEFKTIYKHIIKTNEYDFVGLIVVER